MNKELIELFNYNKRYINREIGLSQSVKLAEKFKSEDNGHLAKILSLRGIRLSPVSITELLKTA